MSWPAGQQIDPGALLGVSPICTMAPLRLALQASEGTDIIVPGSNSYSLEPQRAPAGLPSLGHVSISVVWGLKSVTRSRKGGKEDKSVNITYQYLSALRSLNLHSINEKGEKGEPSLVHACKDKSRTNQTCGIMN